MKPSHGGTNGEARRAKISIPFNFTQFNNFCLSNMQNHFRWRSARLESILEHFVILEDLHIRVRNSKSESKNWETLRERGSITPSSLKRRRNQSSCLAAPVVSFEERHPTIPNVRFFAIPSTIATFYLQFRICCFLGTKCRRQYHRRQYPQTTQPPPPVQASRRRQEMSRFLFSRATLVLQLFNQAN